MKLVLVHPRVTDCSSDFDVRPAARSWRRRRWISLKCGDERRPCEVSNPRDRVTSRRRRHLRHHAACKTFPPRTRARRKLPPRTVPSITPGPNPITQSTQVWWHCSMNDPDLVHEHGIESVYFIAYGTEQNTATYKTHLLDTTQSKWSRAQTTNPSR